MKKLSILLISLLSFACLKVKHTEAKITNENIVPVRKETSIKNFSKIFEKSVKIITNTGNEVLILERDQDIQEVRFSLSINENGNMVSMKVDNINYTPMFLYNDKPSELLESVFLLDFLHNMLGLYDLDNDGTEELFFLYSGASEEGLVVVDYINDALNVNGEVYGFVSFCEFDKKIYMLAKHIKVGPEFLSTNVNDYVAYSYDKKKLKKHNKLPDEAYEYLYNNIFENYKNKNNFHALFFFLYNNNPKILSYQFIDEYLKVDPVIENKYMSYEQVRKLLDSGAFDYDISCSKYFYYYFLDNR